MNNFYSWPNVDEESRGGRGTAHPLVTAKGLRMMSPERLNLSHSSPPIRRD